MEPGILPNGDSIEDRILCQSLLLQARVVCFGDGDGTPAVIQERSSNPALKLDHERLCFA